MAELARLRAGAIAGLALSSRDEAAGLEGAERALPLLRGGASAPSAWIVSDVTGDGYREAPARVVLARVPAGDAEAPGLLRAAFAGAKPERWETIVLALWTAGLAGVLEWGLMRAHR